MNDKTDMLRLKQGIYRASGRNFSRKVDAIFSRTSDADAGIQLKVLTAFAKFSRQQAYNKVYDSNGRFADDYWLYFQNLPHQLNRLLDFPNGQKHYSKDLAEALAHEQAAAAHIRLHHAFRQGRVSGKAESNAEVETALVQAERLYRNHLRTLRDLVSKNQPASILDFQASLAVYLFESFYSLVEQAAATSRFYRSSAPVVGEKNVGLRASRLSRRYSMLLAACQLLHWRLSNKRTRSSSQKIADTRTRLLRQTRFDRTSRESFVPRVSARSTQLFGEVAEVDYIERPQKPYSLVSMTNGQQVRVPYKSLVRQGVRAGSRFIVQGKVKKDVTGYYLEAEFEGSKQHASQYWEDWLADLVRGCYELYPGTLHLEWEFPVNDRQCARTDLLSRIK